MPILLTLVCFYQQVMPPPIRFPRVPPHIPLCLHFLLSTGGILTMWVIPRAWLLSSVKLDQGNKEDAKRTAEGEVATLHKKEGNCRTLPSCRRRFNVLIFSAE